MHRRTFIASTATAALTATVTPLPSGQAGAAAGERRRALVLWYDRPAADWESEGLPIGNGALGAVLFGGIGRERVQFNEKTVWSGGPGEDPAYTGGVWERPRPGALAEARRLILENGPQAPEATAPPGHRDARRRRPPVVRRTAGPS